MSKSSLVNQNPTTIAGASVFFRAGIEKKTVIYVEGGTDFPVFNKLFKNYFCQVKPVFGRPKVYETIDECNKNHLTGTLAIADKDYDGLMNSLKNCENLFYTDTHDIETQILSTTIFLDYLNKYLVKEDVERLKNITNKSVKDLILDISKVIGCARLFIMLNNIRLTFSDTEITSFISKTLYYNLEEYITTLVNYSKNPSIFRKSQKEKEQLVNDIISYADKVDSYNVWELCRGHDLTEIIAFVFSYYAYDDAPITKEDVEEELHNLYTMNLFKQTQLYKSLMEWQKNHPQYRLVL